MVPLLADEISEVTDDKTLTACFWSLGLRLTRLNVSLEGFINVFERVNRAAFKSATSHCIFRGLHNWQVWHVSVGTYERDRLAVKRQMAGDLELVLRRYRICRSPM
jgi:hypothetical protein